MTSSPWPRARGDHGRGRSLGWLFKHAPLDAAQFSQALELARGIESDCALRQTLSRALASQQLATAQQHEVLALADALGSDYERAELLIEAPRFTLDAPALALWRTLLQGMGSDYEKRGTLEALLRARPGDAHRQRRSLRYNHSGAASSTVRSPRATSCSA